MASHQRVQPGHVRAARCGTLLATNMNTGTVQEAVEWVQYANSKNEHQLPHRYAGRQWPGQALEREILGHRQRVVGLWRRHAVEHCLDLYRQYATAMTSYGNTGKAVPNRRCTRKPKPLPLDEEVARRPCPPSSWGPSIHHYSVIDWSKGSSDQFSDKEYFITMEKAWFMEEFVRKNKEMMDKYDLEKALP